MRSAKRFVIGIDPGYGNTGCVLRLSDEQETLEGACWRDEETHEWNILRASAICIPMMEMILGWVDAYDIEELEVIIETPFLSRNPGTLMVQMYLFVLLQSYVFDYLVPVIPKVWLTIVHNATSKTKLAHKKSASKDEMIAASKWANWKSFSYDGRKMTKNQAETMADAYAHSLSAYKEEWPLHKLVQYMAHPNYMENE